ncbi:hypothetical protein ABZ626_16700 [Streptomyces longispororuber]|uniref:hypothetical protein n=1 Tax=Streptomyces longispororuber TaxID=68230 RepID=UPI0033CCAF55
MARVPQRHRRVQFRTVLDADERGQRGGLHTLDKEEAVRGALSVPGAVREPGQPLGVLVGHSTGNPGRLRAPGRGQQGPAVCRGEQRFQQRVGGQADRCEVVGPQGLPPG